MESASDLLDRSLALAAVGGDQGFLAELAGIFSAACPTLLESVRAQLAVANLQAVAHTVHLLRFAAENVSASRVASTALALETSARQGCREAVEAAYSLLLQEVEQLTPMLAELEG